MNKIKCFIFFNIFIFVFKFENNAQFDCLPANNTFVFSPTPVLQTKVIDWAKFPEFSLPFKIIYGGPRFRDNLQLPLKHGFSHLSTYFGADSVNLPIKNRAFIWYGVAFNFQKPQPWQEIRSPWANDIDGYRNKWQSEMAAFATHFEDTKGTNSPAADIFMMDIERHWEGQFTLATDISILNQKNNPLVPKVYSSLTDAQYVDRYKKDMLKLYAEPVRYLKSQELLSKFNKISSYADVPIKYQGLNIEGNQWADWQTNTERLSYLMKDTLTNKLGGDFFNQLDVLSPTCYIQADYASNPKARGGNYLSEFLFQIEVNKAWSSKEISPFVWLKYEDSSLPGNRFVKSYQAEAMAIFPFMAGAKGLWLWDDGNSFNNNDNYATYEYFINGLYKLSLYKSFFEGDFTYYMPVNARDLNVNQSPVWRGVVKGDQILVAAQNPYAAENEVTKLPISYKNWSNSITLKGREVFLCAFKIVDVTAIESIEKQYDLKILDNPLSQNTIKINFQAETHENLKINLKTINGISVFTELIIAKSTENSFVKYLPNLPKGEYLLSFETQNGTISRKIIN
jgi:hypothetical protein